MTEASAPLASTTKALAGAVAGRRAAFSATLLLSAFLLFAIQPLFAKMVLPRLGGTPAVWSVAMVFFQATLLAGYAYAHFLVKHAGVRRALVVHGVLTACAFLWLPIGIAAGFEVPPDSGQPVWLLALLASSVGVPFLAVAANAPLLQAWFARTGDPQAHDPYFLYGASNIGSFLALVSYPLLFEPLFALGDQAKLWTVGYAVLFAAIVACGMIAAARINYAPARSGETGSAVVGWRDRLGWIGWAFLPSALLIGVTAHISTNIAAAPFLWVIPLAIFLLTFVLVFRQRASTVRRSAALAMPLAVAAALMTVFQPALFGTIGGLAVNVFAFFTVAMVWHGSLAARRPAAARLTEFYLFMSIGGVLGGAFTSLAAPMLVDSVAEYPLLLAASFAGLPEARDLLRRPVGLAAAGAALIAFGAMALGGGEEYRDRSFFGVTLVRNSPDGRFNLLYHGTTIHGAEKVSDLAELAERPEPLTYYTSEGPLALATRIQRARIGGPLSVGVIGLGAGSMACHAAEGDSWRFYEIDAAVVRVATDPRYFNFLSRCTPDAPIVLGDARLTVAREPNGSFDVLIVDAFSSDAIPVHLLTREAFREYVAKLKPGGVVVMNITNRFLELPSAVGATARAEGLAAVGYRQERTLDELNQLRARSDVAVLARDAKDVEPFLAAGFAPIPAAGSTAAPWSDNFSEIVSAILRKQGLL